MAFVIPPTRSCGQAPSPRVLGAAALTLRANFGTIRSSSPGVASPGRSDLDGLRDSADTFVRAGTVTACPRCGGPDTAAELRHDPEFVAWRCVAGKIRSGWPS